MSQALAKTSENVAALLHHNNQRIATRLAGAIDPGQFIAVAMTAFNSNPKLLQCDPNTLLHTMYQAAGLGLYLDPVRGEAYPVPFYNSKRQVFECQLIIGYKGYIKLFHKSTLISDISARLVYDKEICLVEYGDTTSIKHTPLSPSKRGKKMGAYAIATMKDGTKHVEFLWGEEIEAIKARSPGGKKKEVKKGQKPPPPSVWETDEDAMWLKSPVRRLAKFIPIGDIGLAAALDERADAGISQYQPIDAGEITLPTEPALPDKTEYVPEDKPADPEKHPSHTPKDIGTVEGKPVKDAPPEGSMDWYMAEIKKVGPAVGKSKEAIRSAINRATKDLGTEEDCIKVLMVLLDNYKELPMADLGQEGPPPEQGELGG